MNIANALEKPKLNPGILEDVVHNLLKNPFASRTQREQHTIVKNGRPTPDLRLNHFTRERYYIHPWLTGSYVMNSFVCWPCLLFRFNPTNIWTNGGFNQLNMFTNSSQMHQCSHEHAEALIEYNQFELSVRYHELEFIRHNEDVQKNRDIIKRLIDICSLINQEFALGRSEQSSCKTSNADLLQYIVPLDEVLQQHLDSNPFIVNMPYNIQDNIMASIESVVNNTVRKEIEEVDFVSFMVDELSDVGNQSQISITLRYVTNDGIKERVLGLFKVEDRTAQGISQVILKTLSENQCLSKVVAQAYDGAAIPPAELPKLQTIIEQAVKGVLLVHCYAHDLNQILSDCASFTPQCKVFFSVIEAISSFFGNTEKHAQLLDRIIASRTNDVKPLHWSPKPWIVNTVNDNRKDIIHLLDEILEHPDDWDKETLSSAKQLLNTMEDFEFGFLLSIFSAIFERMVSVFTTLKEGNFYLGYCDRVMKDVRSFFVELKDKFEEMYEKVVDEVGPPTKRKVARQIKEYYKYFFTGIVDNLKIQIELRFSYIIMQKLQFNSLVDPTQFETYSKKHFEFEIRNLKDSYDRHFHLGRLKNELLSIYKRVDLYNKPLSEVHKILAFAADQGSMPSYSEVIKLMALVLTVPTLSTSEVGSTSYFSRLKRYCRNTPRADRESALAKMTLEKDLVSQVKANPKFQEDVMEEFMKKVPLEEFAFK